MNRTRRLLLGLLAGVAATGTTAFGLAQGGRAATSFLAGLLVATATVTAGVVLVEVAGRIAPAVAMVAALTNYALTVVFFLVLLQVVSPSLANVPAFATGLVSAVLPYLAWQVTKARPGQ